MSFSMPQVGVTQYNKILSARRSNPMFGCVKKWYAQHHGETEFFLFCIILLFLFIEKVLYTSALKSDISPKSGVVTVHPIFNVILKSLSDQNYVLVNILQVFSFLLFNSEITFMALCFLRCHGDHCYSIVKSLSWHYVSFVVMEINNRCHMWPICLLVSNKLFCKVL